jgi:hypothetical protein
MKQFCVGFTLAILAAWALVSGYDMWASIAQFSEIHHLIFNTKIAVGSLFTIGSLTAPWTVPQWDQIWERK